MSEEFTKEGIDAAIILENEVDRRVRAAMRGAVDDAVKLALKENLEKEKERMLMEIVIAVGKTIRAATEQNRRPLWESTPEEFGLTQEELNRSSIRRLDDIQNEINKQLGAIHAIRE